MTAGDSAGQTVPAGGEPERDPLKWMSSGSAHVSCPSQLQCMGVGV